MTRPDPYILIDNGQADRVRFARLASGDRHASRLAIRKDL
jgi:hypothetical protein